MDEDDEFEEHDMSTMERPGHTLGQPAMMSGMSRNLLHSNSISNAPNMTTRGRSASVRFLKNFHDRDSCCSAAA